MQSITVTTAFTATHHHCRHRRFYHYHPALPPPLPPLSILSHRQLMSQPPSPVPRTSSAHTLCLCDPRRTHALHPLTALSVLHPPPPFFFCRTHAQSRHETKRQRLNEEPMSNPAFNNSRVLASCRSHPVFATWANLDRVRASVVELLGYEQKCAKWYSHNPAFATCICECVHVCCVRVLLLLLLSLQAKCYCRCDYV
jgi:hypothetical protein